MTSRITNVGVHAVYGFKSWADHLDHRMEPVMNESGEEGGKGEEENSHMQLALTEDPGEDASALDPIDRITKAALRMCDLSYDRAFAIDNHNLGHKLGEYTMSRLMEIFFDRVYKDPEEWFSGMFAHVPVEDMAQNLSDYLLQRLGGEPYYSGRKGIPALILSHMYVDITPRAAERWLEHFEEALDDASDDINAQQKDLLLDHMRYAAYFLVAAQAQQKEDADAGVQFLD